MPLSSVDAVVTKLENLSQHVEGDDMPDSEILNEYGQRLAVKLKLANLPLSQEEFLEAACAAAWGLKDVADIGTAGHVAANIQNIAQAVCPSEFYEEIEAHYVRRDELLGV